MDLHPHNDFPFLVPPLRECLTTKSPCKMGLAIKNNTMYWNEISDYFCFLTFPIVLVFALFSELISIIVLTRQVRLSLDAYLLGFSLSKLLLVICTAALTLQQYVGPIDNLVYSQPYIVSCRDWFWYSLIWLLVVVSFERAIALFAPRAAILCTPAQAAIATVMVFSAGLASSLPRFWEYRAVMTSLTQGGYIHVLIASKTPSTDTYEYNILYFWYVKGVTLIVPFIMMIMLSAILGCRSRRNVLVKRYTTIKSVSGFSICRRINEEKSGSRLLIILMALYMTCSAPIGALDLVPYLSPTLVDPASRTYASMYNLFTVLFFLQFSFHLMIYLCFSKRFRTTFIAIF